MAMIRQADAAAIRLAAPRRRSSVPDCHVRVADLRRATRLLRSSETESVAPRRVEPDRTCEFHPAAAITQIEFVFRRFESG